MLDIRQFLEEVHGGTVDAGQYFYVWTPKRPMVWCIDVESAAEAADLLDAEGRDVYIPVGMLGAQPEKGRGRVSDVTGIVGLWSDIDIGGSPDKKHPPTEVDALAVIEEVGPQPTILVNSGHGLHGWWLFNEPWVFGKDALAARDLARNWVNTMRAVADLHGWKLDAVGDVTRVLRLPGTHNHKGGGNAPVSVISHAGPRYNPDDFSQYLISQEHTGPQAVAQVQAVQAQGGSAVPKAVVDLLQNDGVFRKLWKGQRKTLDDQSASSYDLALAHEGCKLGWDDQTIADAIYARRCERNQNPKKALRRDYVTRTIGKARVAYQRDAAVRELRELPRPDAKQTSVQKSDLRDQLSRILECSVAHWWKQDGEDPLYTIEFADPKVSVRIGASADVRSFKAFADALYAVDIVLPKKLAKHWDDVLRLLSLIAEVIADPEGTAEARVHGWLSAYLASCHATPESNWREALLTRTPFLRDGSLWLNVDHFFTHVCSRTMDKPTKGELRADLRNAGFVSKQHCDSELNKNARFWGVRLTHEIRALLPMESEE